MNENGFIFAEGLELIPDIDFEYSRSFQKDLGHSRII